MDRREIVKPHYLLVGCFVILLLPVSIAGRSLSWAVEQDSREHEWTEEYRYEAYVPGKGSDSGKEAVWMKIAFGGSGIEYASGTTSIETVEEITIKTDRSGRFLHGKRRINTPGKQPAQERIWRDQDRAYLEQGPGNEKRATGYDLPVDKPLAVDGSLLLLLRSFPFDTGLEWKVFMIDFSGYTVTVTVRQVGVERVSVPAGTFDCYRIEVVPQLFLFKPVLTYWLARAKPHFLVKNIGKRGPFTATYVTSLVRAEYKEQFSSE